MAHVSKVLLVDDEAHIRKFIGLVVKAALNDPEIVEAANGEEAVEQYQAQRPDVVLMDINMPMRSGLEALQDLMAIDPEAVVVMLTSVSNRGAIDQAVERGASGYILKDTPRVEMARALTELVDAIFGEVSDEK
jgi:two-component system chemotaxis response regulator CheY